ncbi:MAG: type IV secretion system protein [Egibacteraceae bacterium]
MTGRTVVVLLVVVLLLADGPSAAAETLVPDEPTGAYPTSRYEIWYALGGFTDVSGRVLGLSSEVVFGAVRMLVSAAVWVVTWAYAFRFAGALAEPAGRLAEAYQQQLVGPLELRYLVLFAAVVYGGWQVLRNRMARGIGELLVSVLVLALGAGLLAAPAEAFRRGVGVTAALSAAVLEVATGRTVATSGDPVDGHPEAVADALEPLTDGVRDAFIAQPHDLLNWGEILSGDCADARDEALATGPHGTGDGPRELMAAAGPACSAYAEFNARPSVERLMGALLVLLAALVVLAVMLLVACTVVVAQLVAVVLVAATPFAVTLGALPGGGRQLLWRWVAAGLRCIAVVVAMAAVLAFMLVTTAALLSSAGHSVRERLAILVLATVAMVILRRRVLAGTQALVARADRRLEGARIGGTHGGGWMRPALAGGLSGLGAGRLAGEGEHDLRELARNRAVIRAHHFASVHRAHRRAGTQMPGEGTGSGASRTGSASARVARLTGSGLRTAANLTIDLPRAAPRGAARVHAATGAATQRVQQRLAGAAGQARSTGREWRQSAAHPVDAYRRELLRARQRQVQGSDG